MLECVTLAQVVELVVEVLVDLAAGTVLDQEASEDSEAAHPEDLAGHTSIGGTLPLTESTVSAFSSGEVQLAGSGSRVHRHRLSDNEAIGDELSDGLAGVGVGDLALLAGIKPDLALAAADDRRGEALLSSQVDPTSWESTRFFLSAITQSFAGWSHRLRRGAVVFIAQFFPCSVRGSVGLHLE